MIRNFHVHVIIEMQHIINFVSIFVVVFLLNISKIWK